MTNKGTKLFLIQMLLNLTKPHTDTKAGGANPTYTTPLAPQPAFLKKCVP